MSIDNIPAELRTLDQWVTHDADKIPHTPGSAHRAYTNRPTSWGSFARARSDVDAGRRVGIGFVFAAGGGIVGVDFDDCIKDGRLSRRVVAWVERFDSYTEISPSGSGIHILCYGELPGKGVKRVHAEIYDRGRFFTVTGNAYGTVRPLRAAQDAINALYTELTAKDKPRTDTPTSTHKPVPLTDDALLAKAFADAHTGEKLKALWSGDTSGYPSPSEAEVALCNILAWWTNKDAERIDRLYRASGLAREKWDRPTSDSTYGALTIENAISTMTGGGYDPEEYRKQQARQDFDDPAKLNILSMAAVVPKRAEYLWTPYIPRGKLTIIAGVSGSTKTWLCCAIAARVSNGGNFVTDDELTMPLAPGVAVYLTKENDLESDLRFRFDKLGANLKNIMTIDERNTDGQGFPLTLTDGRIEAAAERLQPELIIFDPIQSYIGAEIDFHRANEVRPILDKLIALAKRFNCAVVLVAHMSKMTTAAALDRILGSSDFRNAARSILIVGSDPDDRESRVVAHAKNSLGVAGDSIRYHIDNDAGVVYDGVCDLDEDAIVQAHKDTKRNKPSVALDEAVNFLCEVIGADGYATLPDIKRAAEEQGIKRQTLYNARNVAGLQSVILGYSADRKTWWIDGTMDAERFKQERQTEIDLADIL